MEVALFEARITFAALVSLSSGRFQPSRPRLCLQQHRGDARAAPLQPLGSACCVRAPSSSLLSGDCKFRFKKANVGVVSEFFEFTRHASEDEGSLI